MSEHDRQVPEFSFTLAQGQNQFFVELAEALVYELRSLGAPASINLGEIPLPREGLVHVFLPPHEYVSLSRYRPPASFLRRSILISAEQPESHFFAANVPLARDGGAVFDINPRSVRAYRSEGINASLLELGYTGLWDRFDLPQLGREDDASERGGAARERDIDILFLGRLTPRREFALASYAGIFERFRCHLGLSDNSRPNVASGAAFVAGEEKRDLLARAKVLLNVHGEDEPYFEWLRVAEAICAGCAVVSERSSDLAPLQWGRHLLTGQLGSLGLFCAWLVEDVSRRDQMRTEAYELLMRERPLSNAARQLMEAGRQTDAAPVGRDLWLASRQERARGQFREQPPAFEHQPLERADLSNGETLVLRGLKQQLLATLALRRQLARVEYTLERLPRRAANSGCGRVSRMELRITPSTHGDHPSLQPSRRCARRASVTRTVLASGLGGCDNRRRFHRRWRRDGASLIESCPQRASRLVCHDLNRGLAAARNTGVAQARTDRLLMLDADNEVRGITMARLMDALDADPAASFAYGIMERFSHDGPEGLLSCYGWDPLRLRGGNYIDAFALIRREAILAMDGYSYYQRLYGWEDYDLWVRMAESGRHGAFVPEIIARYRVGHGSMISQTNVSTADAYAALVDHAPKVLAGLRIPR